MNMRRKPLSLLTWNGLTGFAEDLEKKEQINHLHAHHLPATKTIMATRSDHPDTDTQSLKKNSETPAPSNC